MLLFFLQIYILSVFSSSILSWLLFIQASIPPFRHFSSFFRLFDFYAIYSLSDQSVSHMFHFSMFWHRFFQLSSYTSIWAFHVHIVRSIFNACFYVCFSIWRSVQHPSPTVDEVHFHIPSIQSLLGAVTPRFYDSISWNQRFSFIKITRRRRRLMFSILSRYNIKESYHRVLNWSKLTGFSA